MTADGFIIQNNQSMIQNDTFFPNRRADSDLLEINVDNYLLFFF